MNFNTLNKDEGLKKPKIDLVNFERNQRQFMNELALKRVQVEDLKKELEAANLKIHQLTRSLETSESTRKEQQTNLNMAIKNARFLEDQLQAKRDSVMKAHLQHNSAVAERESLRELVQKSEMEKYDLVRQLNELKAQRDCDAAYQRDLLAYDAKSRSKIAQLTEIVQKFQNDQEELHQLAKKIETCEELQNTVEFYQNQFYKCKKRYTSLEEKFIIITAALEKLESIKTEHPFTCEDETKIVISQWEKATKRFNQQMQTQKQVIENLTIALKSEKEMNTKICTQQIELENKIDEFLKENGELKQRLIQLTKKECVDKEKQTADTTAADVELTVKSELIVVD